MTISDTLDCLISPPWMASANCRYTDPEIFYPTQAGKWTQARAALKVCSKCPVALDCLNWAFEIGDLHAILGGTTPEQRTKFMKSYDKITGEAA